MANGIQKSRNVKALRNVTNLFLPFPRLFLSAIFGYIFCHLPVCSLYLLIFSTFINLSLCACKTNRAIEFLEKFAK